MNQTIDNYLSSISSKFTHEETSEMGYRTDFEILVKKIFEEINVRRIDHDPKAKQHNKPDFIVLKNDTPILYIEAKDIGISLDRVESSEQMTRYYGYTNLVLTDYVEFRFYRNGLKYGEPIKVAEYNLKNRIITPIPENYENLVKTLLDFTQSQKEPIRSGAHLSKIMAGKARRIRDNVRQFLATESDKNAELVRVYETIKKLLVHDLTKDSFADMYAQTIVYGLFAARYSDESQGNFTRQEARDLIPKSNPFLRDFFDHIVGPNFDKRLEYIVNELCEVFSHANVAELMKEYYKKDLWGNTHSGPDPVIHFYEDFLKEYDPALRKKMGAYYTPLPVVYFIVRSVNYLLKKDFKLAEGLADTSKTADGLHKVQILDPAVGTGTFISKIIGVVYEHLIKTGQKGRWHPYVLHDLLPRLYGFELMMTPYTIAHLKLSMAFRDTGFKYFNDRRLGIFLTNTLEEGVMQQGLFTAFGLAESIAEESKEASKIKNERPIMVVIGNPPYSGESSNVQYTGNNVYKVEPGGGKLQERNSKWLNDDYVKFIRFAESMIEKTGEGIVGMITAHGYIDNPTFRGMRWHLMSTFDEIYVLDLHGNTNKKEKAPDGSEDQNVFNIRTGVAIFFGIKKKDSKPALAKIYRSDLYGKSLVKFKYLDENSIDSVKWIQVIPSARNYDWIVQDHERGNEYYKGFSVKDLFLESTLGYQTHRDDFSVCETKEQVYKKIEDFSNLDVLDLRNKYKIKESNDWSIEKAVKSIKSEESIEKYVTQTSYRPFDNRWTLLHKSFCDRPRELIIESILNRDNCSLEISRQIGSGSWQHVFISDKPSESCLISNKSKEGNYSFPLYIYKEGGEKSVNLSQKIVNEIEKIVGKTTGEDIFNYVYSILHSPNYRGKYRDFLKSDFSWIPYPKNTSNFKELTKFGQELRDFHLLKSSKVNQFITTYPNEGSNVVEKIDYKDGNVYINETQCFGNVPHEAWGFYIGGYQPAQKWLKDRKGQELTNEDIEHYQKMIVALAETDKIQKEIDRVVKEKI